MVEIDGSFGEGGGQILRTSVSLAAVTGQPLRVANVRAKRSRPGLQPQHLAAVKAAATLCGAEVDGAEVGSTAFTFRPNHSVQPGEYRFDIGTAGAATLVLQTVIVPLALTLGESVVTVTGGTHNPMAPPVEYLEFVYLVALARAGLISEMDYSSAGFYPKGGGEVRVRFSALNGLKPLDLSVREASEPKAVVLTAELPPAVAERGRQTLRSFLPNLNIDVRSRPSRGPGAAVFGHSGFGGFTALGERGKPIENVALECGSALEKWLAADAPVDEHLADQLVLPMALTPGTSRWRTIEVTEHLRTVAWLVTAFLPVATEIEELSDGTGIVRVDGVKVG
jgi:RNA 3'-terminal phosphate cyclase (ATP)